MTLVPEASECSVTTRLASAALLRPDQIWPDSAHRGLSVTRTVHRPGASCAGLRPAEFSCDVSFPFVDASVDGILLTLGADRLTTGEVHAEIAAPSGAIPSQAAVLYTTVHFDETGPAYDSARTGVERAVISCVGGKPGHLGVDGLVGERESVLAVRSFQNAFFVFSASGHDLVWLVVDGAGWTASRREEAAATAIAAVTS